MKFKSCCPGAKPIQSQTLAFRLYHMSYKEVRTVVDEHSPDPGTAGPYLQKVSYQKKFSLAIVIVPNTIQPDGGRCLNGKAFNTEP